MSSPPSHRMKKREFWCFLPNFPAAPGGAAFRLTRCFGCACPKPGGNCRNVFRGVKRGLFSKSPLFASPLRHFLFASFSFVPEHPVNQSPSAVRASFSPRRRTAPLSYFICPRSCYLPEAKNILPTVLRSFSLCENRMVLAYRVLSQRKRRTMESDDGMERVTLRQGGGIWNAPDGVGF